MCMSCGCKMPNEKHGNEANITLQDLEQAAQAGSTTAEKVAENILQTYNEKVATLGGRSSTSGPMR